MSEIKPVAWMHNGFVSTNKDRVDYDEMRNRQCGFKAKPIIELYDATALAAAREQALEEAAKVCDTEARMYEHLDVNGRSRYIDYAQVAATCAATIRKLKE